jgi:hypothetical protein
MSTRLIPLLLLAAAVAFACGPRLYSKESGPVRKHSADSPAIGATLDVKVKDRVSFALRVTNNAEKRLELTFPSGQTHDIVVLDQAGHEVWRWSEGRMFTQALQNRLLATDETLSYQASWSPSANHGTFVAVASLRSENHPLEQRVQFTLP